MFTMSARSNPGSGAPMGSHGLHSIDRIFRRKVIIIIIFVVIIIIIIIIIIKF